MLEDAAPAAAPAPTPVSAPVPAPRSAQLLAPTLSERLVTVQGEVALALAEAGRAKSDTTLIVITKYQPLSMIRELIDLGVSDFGESRHQEAQAKSEELDSAVLRWHFIGQLQSKKARAVARYASLIHSIDRDNLVDALVSSTEEIDNAPVGVFVQVNLAMDAAQSPEAARGGVAPTEVERLAERVALHPRLNLLGVMAIAPLGEEPRPAFARLRQISESLVRVIPTARFISSGMSGDYREAILEGATHLRIGSAITGLRPVAE